MTTTRSRTPLHLLLPALLPLAAISVAHAAVIAVPADQPSIQAGIDAAVHGDEVVVAPGTYVENVNLLGKAIVLRSTDPMDPAVIAATVIDGNATNSVIICNSGEGADTVVSGFTITNGSWEDGGGMRIEGSSPTVTRCIFTGNVADSGGGMRNGNGSSPTVSYCTFIGNGGNNGGAMTNATNCNPVIHDCAFIENEGFNGGAIRNDHNAPTIIDCSFIGNTADGSGGSLYNRNVTATITRCRFIGNSTAGFGGGMYNRESTPTIANCTFSGNSAGSFGGGLYNLLDADAVVLDCTFSGNSASNGGGISNSNSAPTITNCILWGDVPNELSNLSGAAPNVTYCAVAGGAAGAGNIDADPLFVDHDGADDVVGTEDDDLRLAAGSPCIDAGNSGAVPVDLVEDLDGNARIVDDPDTADTGLGMPVVDLGAYERQPARPCLADIDGSGDVGFADLLVVLGAWGACDGAPCPADLNGDGAVTFDDLLAILAAWGACPSA